MNLTQDIIASNAPIGTTAPAANFIEGAKAGQDQGAIAYQQQLQMRLQKAIHKSVDYNGNLNYNELIKNGHRYGIDQQVFQYIRDNNIKRTDDQFIAYASQNNTEYYQPKETHYLEFSIIILAIVAIVFTLISNQ